MRRKTSLAAAGALGLLLPLAPLGGAGSEPLLSPASAQSEAEPVLVADFEDGTTQEWFGRGDATVEVSTEQAHTGEASLLTTGRTDTWHGPGRDVLDVLEPGTTYEIEAAVRLADDAGTAPVHMTVQRTPDGGSTVYERVVSDATVTDDAWATLSGTYRLPTTAGTELQLYLESGDPDVDFHIDDVTVTPAPAPPVQTDIPSLHEVLADEFPIGVAIDQRETTDAPADLLTHHFNSITAENHMKWESIQPSEGEFTFEEADHLVEFANDNDLRVWGHTLVWHSQTPDWVFENADGEPLTSSPEDRELLLQRMEDHIRALGERYGDDIDAWDVVNEVVDESEPDGLRRSPWFEVIGPDYIAHAFEIANEVFPNADLYINDYNTELPGKRQAMYEVVERLQAEGVPIDGVGHQLHLNLARPISGVEQTLQRFTELDVDQAVTELDVSVARTSAEELPEVPQDRLVEQGHYYATLFDVLRDYSDELASVSVWGLYDTRSWLRTWPIERMDAPLLFDDDLQAKPAYWGIVDRDELPHLPQSQNVPAGTVTVDGDRDLEWRLLPNAALPGALDAGFQARWHDDGLSLLVEVADPQADPDDRVDVFLPDTSVTIGRDGSHTDVPGLDVVVAETDDGYRIEADLPLDGTELGADVPFDLRVTDGGDGTVVSWSDQGHQQEDDPSRWGTLLLIEEVARAAVPYAADPPQIDGDIDQVWDSGAPISTTVDVEGSGGATADARLLWDDTHLYILAEVTDPELDDSHPDPWQQDSIELFVSPDNNKGEAYGPGDGQYRINFANVRTVTGGPEVSADLLTSATQVVDDGYVVEAAVELPHVAPEVDGLLGFELQVNDATGGTRTAVTTWHDPTGQSYANTTRWGVLHLVDEDGGTEPPPDCDVTVEDHHRGPLHVNDGTTCLEAGSSVRGDVTVTGGASLRVTDAIVTGAVTTIGADTVHIAGSRLTGPLTLIGTTGSARVTDSRVTGPVTLNRNTTGDTPIVFGGNTVVGALLCVGNRPAPTDGGTANTVRGHAVGQCAEL